MQNWMWIVLAGLIVIAGVLFFQGTQPTSVPQPEGIGGGPGVLPKKMEIELNAVDKEQIDQSGRVFFEERDGKVTVTVDVNKVEGLNNQPAHIHAGECPGVGEVLYPLSNVVDGRSVTEINATLDQLGDTQNPMALNIHKSAEESSVYTSCGNL